MIQLFHKFFGWVHASIRTRLIAAYFTSVVLAVLLTPAVYYGLSGFLGFNISSSAPSVIIHLMVVAAGASLIYGYLLGRSIIQQVEAMAKGVRSLAAGELKTRIPVLGNDELAQLAVAFNNMVMRLQEAEAQQTQIEQARRDLVANVAHDLRTPLAAIQAAGEALEAGVVEDEATRTRYLAAIRRETRHLSQLIDDLFALSQLEAGQLELKPEPLYLEDIVQDCLTGLLPQMEQQGLELKVDLPTTLPPAEADRLATRRILTNLLQNALAFTPAGGRITVRSMPGANEILVEVSDTGPGIATECLEASPEGLPHIFERFYREDQARSGGGAGLGLAIARELTQAQGGRIWITSAAGVGTTIGFSLPIARA